MGYGSEAATAGSATSSAGAVGNAVNGANTASSIGSAGGGAFNAMQAADSANYMSSIGSTSDAIANGSGGTAATSAVGGSMQSLGVDSSTASGPAIGPTTSAATAVNNGANPVDAGVQNPWYASAGQMLRRGISDYAEGGKQDLLTAYDNMGFNMKTAGYLGSKIPTSGGAPPMAPMQINNSFSTNQQDPLAEFKQRRQRMGY
jgi:hypothetical protein